MALLQNVMAGQQIKNETRPGRMTTAMRRKNGFY